MISRREWFSLVGKLGVIGAAASLGMSFPAHAVTRPTATLNSLYLNVSPRPVISSRSAPRVVHNLMDAKYRSYRKNSTANWSDSPTDTAAITWGYNVDGGQWFEATATVTTAERVYASFLYRTIVGERYVLSWTVDSKSGTHGVSAGSMIAVGGGAVAQVNNAAVGRGAATWVAPATENVTIRFGVGCAGNNGATGTMRFSNIMLERVPAAITYPSEYVTPGDQRAFPYTYSNSVVSNVVQTATNGTPYAIPRRSSVLVIGDSMTNDDYANSSQWGDFPFRARRVLAGNGIAISSRGVASMRIDQITPQIAAAFAETDVSAGVAPYTLCVSQGGTNDISQSRTLAQMQAAKLEQIQAILDYGMYPVLIGVPPYNAASAGQQTVLDGFNAWLKTLGYPMYDVYADADNGSGDYNARFASLDGVHPGELYAGGYAIMGQRLADLIQLVGD